MLVTLNCKTNNLIVLFMHINLNDKNCTIQLILFIYLLRKQKRHRFIHQINLSDYSTH